MAVEDITPSVSAINVRWQRGGRRHRRFIEPTVTITGNEAFTGGTFAIGGQDPKIAAPWLVLPPTFDHAVPIKMALNPKYLLRPGMHSATVKCAYSARECTFDVNVLVGPQVL